MDESKDLSIKLGELANHLLNSKFKIAHPDTLVAYHHLFDGETINESLGSLRVADVIRYEVSRDTVEPRQFLWMRWNVA
jgi:hypothetical protein